MCRCAKTATQAAVVVLSWRALVIIGDITTTAAIASYVAIAASCGGLVWTIAAVGEAGYYTAV